MKRILLASLPVLLGASAAWAQISPLPAVPLPEAPVPPAAAESAKEALPPAQPATVVAALAEIVGRVRVKAPEAADFTPGTKDQPLTAGTEIQALKNSSAIVALSNGTKLRIGANGKFKLEELTPTSISVFMGLGKLEAWVKGLAGGFFKARTPAAVASVRGTVFAMNVISATQVECFCFSGALDVADNFGRVTPVAQGQTLAANVEKGAAEGPKPLPPDVTAPAEPPVAIPVAKTETTPTTPLEPAPAEKPAEKPAEEPAPTTTPTTTTQPPPPNPVQETTTASPSSP